MQMKKICVHKSIFFFSAGPVVYETVAVDHYFTVSILSMADHHLGK